MAKARTPSSGRQKGSIDELPSGALRVRVTPAWIPSQRRHDLIEVVELGPKAAAQAEAVRARLVAEVSVHDEDGALVYAGDVGTGFTDATRRTLLEQLARDTLPFDGPTQLAHAWPGRARRGVAVHWLHARLVGEIEYRAFSSG